MAYYDVVGLYYGILITIPLGIFFAQSSDSKGDIFYGAAHVYRWQAKILIQKILTKLMWN